MTFRWEEGTHGRSGARSRRRRGGGGEEEHKEGERRRRRRRRSEGGVSDQPLLYLVLPHRGDCDAQHRCWVPWQLSWLLTRVGRSSRGCAAGGVCAGDVGDEEQERV
eukprot:122354-Hanusia_phi.AAC.2